MTHAETRRDPDDSSALLMPDATDLDAILSANHGAPFSCLGPQQIADGWVVRVLAPGADQMILAEDGGSQMEMMQIDEAGLFAIALPDRPTRYRVTARNADSSWSFVDPYQFGPLLGPLDDHLIAEGAHMRLWRTLGAHLLDHEGAPGARFAVWAPDARRVSVIGEFNGWDGRRHPMRRRDGSGIWELFVPDLTEGTLYKFEVAGNTGDLPTPKSDPVGFQSELRPGNCSILRHLDHHVWRDDAWMSRRGARNRTDSAISIYEVHLGSWRRHEDGRWLGYRELAETLVPYVKKMGFTHLEIMPISEHPFDGSWGYQPVGLFAPTSRFGDLDDFRALIEACHAAEIGVILDWVPAHFPIDEHGLGRFDGSALYEHADPREGFHPDWNTLIYDLGRPEVSNFLLSNAVYWLTEHHIDGLRVDAVASMLYRDYSREDGEWVPNRDGGRENFESIDFLRRMNASVLGTDPSVMTVAEESTAWPGVTRSVQEDGLGFGFKWNMGWMFDTLHYMARDPSERPQHHNGMRHVLSYAFDENFILSVSHDEVVHGKGSLFGKMPGDAQAKLANLRAYYAFLWAHPGKKLLFMGQEFGDPSEWDADAALDWNVAETPGHDGLSRLVRDLNATYRGSPALHVGDCRRDGFAWIDADAADASVFAWVRKGADGDAPVLAVFNFSDRDQAGWRLGVPAPGRWREMLNSDAPIYGGAGRGNLGGVDSEPVPSHGHPQSITLTLPALTGIYFQLEGAA